MFNYSFCKLFISLLLINIYFSSLQAQEKLSKSELSFSKIKTKVGTRGITLTNDYGKKWKSRISFPENQNGDTALIIALHWAGGGDTYKEFNDCLVLPSFKSLNAIIISPEGENQLWNTANNIDKILSITQYAKKYWSVDPTKIAIMGYSNGGNGSWFFAEKYPEIFSAAIPMASAYRINAKIEVPLYVIHGKKDELFEFSKTKKLVIMAEEREATVTFVAANELSHFEACSYTQYLKQATKWLKGIWEKE